MQFHRVQPAAGIHLPCHGDHKHTSRCHVYGFHSHRRGFATLNVDRMTLRQIQTALGHSTPQMTQDYYINPALDGLAVGIVPGQSPAPRVAAAAIAS